MSEQESQLVERVTRDVNRLVNGLAKVCAAIEGVGGCDDPRGRSLVPSLHLLDQLRDLAADATPAARARALAAVGAIEALYGIRREVAGLAAAVVSHEYAMREIAAGSGSRGRR